MAEPERRALAKQWENRGVARRYSLAEIGKKVGGMDYTAVAMARQDGGQAHE